MPGAESPVVPRSVVSRQLANPFLAPDFEAAAERIATRARRLAGWELLEPLFRSFECAAPGAPACIPLPEARSVSAPPGRELMPHQAKVVAATAGRRLPAAGRGAQRGEDELGARCPAVDAVAPVHFSELSASGHRRCTHLRSDLDRLGCGHELERHLV